MANTNPLLDWSELVPDILSLVYKCLSFADFARARTVCSSWYSVSRSSSPRKNHIPWLIFNQDSKWQLFNSEEGKFYTTQINTLGFSDCRTLATCGNWILVTDNKAYLYIINPFTLKVINLPPLKPNDKTLGNYSMEQRTKDFGSLCRSEPINIVQVVRVQTAVLWVDKRTNDYLVVWPSWRIKHIVFCRKGDEEWSKKPCEYLGQGEEDVGFDMAYKDKKLYILTDHGTIRILDFSQDFPRDVTNHLYINRPFYNRFGDVLRVKLTTSGNVLIIRCKSREKIKFKVYKMNITSEVWERVDSLEEEEAVVWNLSVTLPTKGVSGIKKDSVYFSSKYFTWFITKVGNYEIPTDRVEFFEQCNERFEHCRDLLGVGDARWFLPCFAVGE